MNSKIGILGVLMLVLVGILAVAVSAALPVTVGQIELEGTVLTPDDVTRLDLERGQTVDVRLEITSPEALSNVEITGFISGYEYNDFERMADTTHVFDMEPGVKYVKTLTLTIPSRVEESDYKLRLIITDRNGEEQIINYNLKIDVARHSIQIKDVVFNPEQEVMAGRALLSTVRIKNVGEKTEESVKVKVAIPALGISASDYIDEIEADDSTTSEELYLRIPATAEPGDYKVFVTVEYDEGYETLTGQTIIHVTEAVCTEDACENGGSSTGKDNTVISISGEAQELVKGEGGSVYPIALTNNGKSAATYVIKVDGTEGWATSRISPSNVIVLAPGESSTVFVYVSALDDAAAGDHMFSVSISSADNVLKQVPFKATVVGSQATGGAIGWDKIKTALEIGFIILVVILVVLGLIIGFSKLRDKEEPEEVSGQTYY